MAQKGGKVDASGEKIISIRVVTDQDADTGIGGVLDPVRVDPTGTTVQPVSVSGSITVGNLPSTQPISAVSLPLPTGAAQDATLTGGSQKTKLVDSGGVNVATVSAAGAVKVDGSAVTQPVSGTVTTTPPANASTNVAQINGVTPLMGNGTTGTGSPRVTLPTDQSQFTGAVLASEGPAAAGTAAGKSGLAGAVANNSAPTATTGQQIALQSDLAGNQRVNPTGSAGSFKHVVFAGASGVDATATVPAGKKWDVKAVAVLLACSATAATRTVILGALDPAGSISATDIFAAAQAGITQTAGQTIRYTFAPSVPTTTSGGNTTVGFPEVVLGPGAGVKTFITNIQAGDVATLTLDVIEYND